jgi:hypothetical protein
MTSADIMYNGHEELANRIEQLKAVIERCKKHSAYTGDHIEKLQDVVAGMEVILDKYESVAGVQ